MQKEEKEPLVSVIVPVYNVRAYLEKSLESILHQTYKSIEVIVIDDGSDDGSSQICEHYAQMDKRVRVYTQGNQGVAIARNLGIKKAKGNFVTFVDSDDLIDSRYIEVLCKDIKKYNADISISNIQLANDEDGVNSRKKIACSGVKTYNNIEALEEIFYQKAINNSLWQKMYKRELFNDIEFPAGMIYEDLAVVYKIFIKAKKIVKDDAVSYYYMIRPNSEMRGEFNKKYFDVIKVCDSIEKVVRTQTPELAPAMRSRCLNARFHVLRMIDKRKFGKEYEDIKKYIKKNRAVVLRDKNVKIKTKVAILLSYFNIDLVRFVYNMKIVKNKQYMR